MWTFSEEKKGRAASKQFARNRPRANWNTERGLAVTEYKRRKVVEFLDAHRPDICDRRERCVGAFVLLAREPQPLWALIAMMLASRPAASRDFRLRKRSGEGQKENAEDRCKR
jgi:hypothetical protein